ncbi:MAG: hypothetical protein PVH65_08695 [Chloroflexota bacterium]|jgi:hypothetical protein
MWAITILFTLKNRYHSAGGVPLIEMVEEWQIGQRHFSQTSMTALLEPEPMTEAGFLPMPISPFRWQ